jgi:hypothetical protein
VEKETARGTEFSRREMLGVTAAGVVAGATAVGMLGEGAAAASVTSARRATSAAPVAMVRRHVGANVEVVMTEGTKAARTLPVHGFPDGWRLRSGDLVWVRKRPEGAAKDVASPLVRPVTGSIAGRPEAGKVLRIADSEALVSDHTITEVGDHPDAAAPYVAQVMDNAAGQQSVCMAVKPLVAPLRG